MNNEPIKNALIITFDQRSDCEAVNDILHQIVGAACDAGATAGDIHACSAVHIPADEPVAELLSEAWQAMNQRADEQAEEAAKNVVPFPAGHA